MIFFEKVRIIGIYAEVAELADALGSGSSGRKAVRVRVPPSAPKKLCEHLTLCCLIDNLSNY